VNPALTLENLSSYLIFLNRLKLSFDLCPWNVLWPVPYIYPCDEIAIE
jgi:hypothetical protein